MHDSLYWYVDLGRGGRGYLGLGLHLLCPLLCSGMSRLEDFLDCRCSGAASLPGKGVGGHEWGKRPACFCLAEAEIVVEEAKELTLHVVDIEGLEHGGGLLPVDVLGSAVVEVLGSDDERGEEDTVPRAWHVCKKIRSDGGK